MRKNTLVVAAALAAASVAAAQNAGQFLYSINRPKITAFSIDANQGTLTPVPGSTVYLGPSTGAAAIDPSGRFLYVSDLIRNTTLLGIKAFRIDYTTGALTRVPGSPFLTPHLPTSLSIDASGRFLYADESGRVDTFTVDDQLGSLTPAGPPTLSGSNHLVANPSAEYLFASSKNDDLRNVYGIDLMNGELTNVANVRIGATALALNPSGTVLYAHGSRKMEVLSFDSATGALTPITGSPFPFQHATVPAMVLDPTDRFLYALDNTSGTPGGVIAYLLNAGTGGLLTTVPGSPFATGVSPSSLVTDRSGKFLYVGNSGSNNISAYLINGVSGALTPLEGSPFATNASPISLLAVVPASVTPPTLVSLQVTPPSITIVSSDLKQPVQFTAVGQYNDGSSRFLTASAAWSSSDTRIATVGNSPNHAGLAHTTGFGVATLTAKVDSFTASATLNVNHPALVSVVVTPANPILVAGTSIQFTATATYSDGSKGRITKTATWASSDTAVATIDAPGNADAASQGSATISAIVGSVTGSTVLTVR